jgi:hypothetical protein
MAGRRAERGRRLLERGLDLVGDRAPWLSDRAYRAVATPFQWLDPAGAAEAAHARLDGVRDRIDAMARTGRVPRGEPWRLRRDLSRTRDDLSRISSRLSPVQARLLALRVAQYSRALDPSPRPAAGPGRPPTDGLAGRAARRRVLVRRGRDAAVLTGAATAAWAGLLLPAAGTAVVEGGLVAGAATGVAMVAARSRRARRERLAALARALATVDATTTRPGGPSVPALDRARRLLVRRAIGSGRLDGRGLALLRASDSHLDDLLVRLVDDDLDADVAFLVQATVTRYLPDTLDPFLALADPNAVVRGRPAAVEVADQLAAVEKALAEARSRPSREHPQTRLLLQGEFLRSKFGDG